MKMSNLLKISLLMLSLFTFTQQNKNILFFEYAAIAELKSFKLSYNKNNYVNFPNLHQAFTFKNNKKKMITFKIYQVGNITEGQYKNDKISKIIFHYYIDLDDKQKNFSNLPNNEFDIKLIKDGNLDNEALQMSENISFNDGLRLIPTKDRITRINAKPSKTEINRNGFQSILNEGMFTVDKGIFALPDSNLGIFDGNLPGPHNLNFQLDMFIDLKDVSLKHVKIVENMDVQISRLLKFDVFKREDLVNQKRFKSIYKRKIY